MMSVKGLNQGKEALKLVSKIVVGRPRRRIRKGSLHF